MTDAEPSSASPSPAIVKVVYWVGAGQAATFDDVLKGMLKVAGSAGGWCGAVVLKPKHSDDHAPGEWQIVLRFQTDRELRRWRESSGARVWRAKLEALTIGAPRVERVHGFEAWFALPNRHDVPPAPKWKMALITSLAIYPLILLLPEALSPVIAGAPPWLANLASVAVAIPLMTWLVMPGMTQLFRGFLYGSAADS